MTLGKQKPKITTNRSMIKRTFLEKGVDYAGEVISTECKRFIHYIRVEQQERYQMF